MLARGGVEGYSMRLGGVVGRWGTWKNFGAGMGSDYRFLRWTIATRVPLSKQCVQLQGSVWLLNLL